MTFKQLLQAEAIDVCQIDSCRLAGVTEILSVLLMAAKYVYRRHPTTPKLTRLKGLASQSAHMLAVLGYANTPFT